MAVTCTAASLESAAKCFECLSPKQHLAVQTYLLAVIAGGSTDPKALMALAKCYGALTPDDLQRIQVALLCEIVNA